MTVDHHPNEQPQSHSKALSSIKRSLHVAGLLFDREGARLALPVLTELAPRLEALRSLLPNLGNTIDALTSACHLTVRGADHTKLLKRESKVSFNGAAGFSAWLIEQLTHKSPPVHDPAWLDVMAVRWLHSSATGMLELPFEEDKRGATHARLHNVARVSPAALVGCQLPIGPGSFCQSPE